MEPQEALSLQASELKRISDRAPRPKFERELFVAAILVFGASFSTIVSLQDAVHFALTWSLISTHSISLNGTLYAGQPYVTLIGSRVFSALPPGLSFLSLPFVAPAEVILPLQPSVVGVYLATYFSCVAGAAGTVVFFKVAQFFGTIRSALLASVVFAFGTGMWTYSRIYLPEALALLLTIASFHFILKMLGHVTITIPRLLAFSIISGSLLGLGIFVDNMAVFLLVAMVPWIFLMQRQNHVVRAKGYTLLPIAGFAAGLTLCGALPVGYYDFLTTGNPLVAPYGIPLIGGVEPSTYSNSILQGIYTLILSPGSGLLLYSPFLVFSAIGVLFLLREKRIGLSALFIGFFLAILIPFSLQNFSAYTHNTVGPSELILSIPFVLVPSVHALDTFFERRSLLGYIAIFATGVASILINGIVALTDPAVVFLDPAYANGGGAANTSTLLVTNVPLFLGQSYLTWWSFFMNSWVYAVSVLVFAVSIFFIYWISALKSFT